ncbi:MAG: glycosyltransferase family 2 protein [Propionibacteriaceae bacterium]
MKNSRPLVSIGLPVYNGERFLRQSIDSLLRQDFTDFELIIADNASTDGTAAIITEAAGDRRVRVLRHRVNQGLAANWNSVVPLARGHYFKWAAADDVHQPGYLTATVRLLEEHPEVALAHSRTLTIDEFGTVVGEVHPGVAMDHPNTRARFRSLSRSGWPCVQVFGLTRLRTLQRTGLHGAYPRSDRPLLAEIGLYGKLVNVDEPLFLRRDFGGRATRSHDLRQRYAVFTGRSMGPRVFPEWDLYRGFLGGVRRAGLPPADTVACTRALMSAMWFHRKTLKDDLFTGLRARPA